jgi:hypothetical protein
MCRKTLSSKLEEKYTEMLSSITEEMKTTKWVSTTADKWSVNTHSYLGVTAHWITDDLERHSAALACRRFVGSHTYDRIAENLCAVHNTFVLDTAKTSHTVTDGASNFRKAFAEYEQAETEEEENVMFTDISSVLDGGLQDSDSDEGENCEIILPKHLRCCSHTLNLIASTDADDAN